MMEQGKKNAGIYAVDFIKQGMNIGVGSGSTVYWFIEELGKRVKQGLEIVAVPTSTKTEQLAKDAGINLSSLNDIDRLSLTIDGADEIDPHGQLIKGGGGALLQEKIVAAASDHLIIIADSSKLVQQLGKFPLPVEVIPFGDKQVKEQIIRSGLCKKISLRQRNNEVFITDHHHYILDCECEKIADASALNLALHLIPGIVETGLFINMANKAIIGYEDGRVEVLKYR
ncbi:MAG TPA: ribose-5-phosphate isomerase RpiA [Chitinophagaceae bacterium]|jgi:ribose 5-phosphate isomerase A|nr:ribose-5-phosphate isomerase RpiA [Chitinophagaceae bacterium]